MFFGYEAQVGHQTLATEIDFDARIRGHKGLLLKQDVAVPYQKTNKLTEFAAFGFFEPAAVGMASQLYQADVSITNSSRMITIMDNFSAVAMSSWRLQGRIIVMVSVSEKWTLRSAKGNGIFNDEGLTMARQIVPCIATYTCLDCDGTRAEPKHMACRDEQHHHARVYYVGVLGTGCSCRQCNAATVPPSRLTYAISVLSYRKDMSRENPAMSQQRAMRLKMSRKGCALREQFRECYWAFLPRNQSRVTRGDEGREMFERVVEAVCGERGRVGPLGESSGRQSGWLEVPWWRFRPGRLLSKMIVSAWRRVEDMRDVAAGPRATAGRGLVFWLQDYYSLQDGFPAN
nr:hypothetical protein CFP56_26119 [Quercus suber]